jgi:Fur family ferric uptake transcriptional regulator
MICTKCRKIFEFQNEELERLQARISADHGFHMLQHKMEIYGICGKCLKDRTRLIPLDMAKPGERLAVIDISGGANARMRLLTMGLKKGDEVEVITNNGQGQVVIAADYQRYALGRGLAQKIMVQTKSEPSIDATPATAPGQAPQSCADDNATDTESPPMKLSELREGQSGRIHKVGGAGALRRRLLEMGLLKGTRLYVEKYAPLKDPVELIVKGCHISLRVEEAAHLLLDEVRQESGDGSQAS